MIDRLQTVEDRYNHLNELLSDPDVISDTKKLREYSKEQADLSKTVEVYREYKTVTEELKEAKSMQQETMDKEMEEMVKMEIDELLERQTAIEEKLHVMLLPKDPNDDKNVIVEIRGCRR